jgi:hypothetical protein
MIIQQYLGKNLKIGKVMIKGSLALLTFRAMTSTLSLLGPFF